MGILLFFLKGITKLFIRLFRIPSFHFISGANSSHFYSLLQLLNSITVSQKKIESITIYDLGLLQNEREVLLNKFPEVKLIHFPFEKYPAYFNIKINAGEYAWKPIIINESLHEKKESIIWLDAGCFVHDELWFYQIWVWFQGFYSPFSSGIIKDWTHPLTLQRMNAGQEISNCRNLSGGVVAASYQSQKARQLIGEWERNALDKMVIAPEGSSRLNHRQDQALLSVLFYTLYRKVFFYGRQYGVKVQMDID